MVLSKNWETAMSKLIAKTWLNDDLYKRFLNDPAAILREAGLMIEEFVDVKVIQNLTGGPVLQMAGAEGGNTIYEIPLPVKPAELKDEQISTWVEGTGNMLPAGLQST
jgi:hypothetical protein